MEKKISILHLEDQEADSILVKALISKGFSSFDYYLAEDETDFIKALEEKKIDVILSDYQLPDYSGVEALAYAKKMVDSSLSELECLPDSKARRLLARLVVYITKRER